jgi:hypothetical protein
MGQTGADALAQDLAFELGEHREQTGHGAACGCGEIECFRKGNETDSEMLQFLERRDQIRDRAAPTIQSPNQHDIDFAAARGSENVSRSSRCDAPEPTSLICAAMIHLRLAAYSRKARICKGRVCWSCVETRAYKATRRGWPKTLRDCSFVKACFLGISAV